MEFGKNIKFEGIKGHSLDGIRGYGKERFEEALPFLQKQMQTLFDAGILLKRHDKIWANEDSWVIESIATHSYFKGEAHVDESNEAEDVVYIGYWVTSWCNTSDNAHDCQCRVCVQYD